MIKTMSEKKCDACGHRSLITSTVCIGCLERSDREMRELKDELICLRLHIKLSRSLLRHVFAEYQKLQKLQGFNGGGEG